MVDGVKVTSLKNIANEQGAILGMLRNDSQPYSQFGEIYFSRINPGVVKGWHLHKVSISNYAVPVGHIKLVIYDPRDAFETFRKIMEIEIGEDNYQLVTIPTGVWSSFKCISSTPALLANCATAPHNPKDVEKKEINSPDISYHWEM